MNLLQAPETAQARAASCSAAVGSFLMSVTLADVQVTVSIAAGVAAFVYSVYMTYVTWKNNRNK